MCLKGKFMYCMGSLGHSRGRKWVNSWTLRPYRGWMDYKRNHIHGGNQQRQLTYIYWLWTEVLQKNTVQTWNWWKLKTLLNAQSCLWSKKELCKFPLNPGLKLDIQRGCPKLIQEENVKQIFLLRTVNYWIITEHFCSIKCPGISLKMRILHSTRASSLSSVTSECNSLRTKTQPKVWDDNKSKTEVLGPLIL